LFEHDLRANAFRVCREGKPVSTFPDHALDKHYLGRNVRLAENAMRKLEMRQNVLSLSLIL